MTQNTGTQERDGATAAATCQAEFINLGPQPISDVRLTFTDAAGNQNIYSWPKVPVSLVNQGPARDINASLGGQYTCYVEFADSTGLLWGSYNASTTKSPPLEYTLPSAADSTITLYFSVVIGPDSKSGTFSVEPSNGPAPQQASMTITPVSLP